MSAHDLVTKQAEDDGLWFVAKHATESYLQDALRKLHTAVETEPLGLTHIVVALERIAAEVCHECEASDLALEALGRGERV